MNILFPLLFLVFTEKGLSFRGTLRSRRSDPIAMAASECPLLHGHNSPPIAVGMPIISKIDIIPKYIAAALLS
jgi:hypothetical protein